MSDFFKEFCKGYLQGSIIFLALFGLYCLLFGPFYEYSQNVRAITECKRNLPRSQNCVLIAVPKLILDAKEGK